MPAATVVTPLQSGDTYRAKVIFGFSLDFQLTCGSSHCKRIL